MSVSGSACRLVRAMIGAAIGGASIMVFTGSALAESEVIMRQTLPFEACKTRISQLPASMNATPEQVSTEVDTGAIFKIRISASQSSLLLSCNKVTDQVEITRFINDTPDNAVASANIGNAS